MEEVKDKVAQHAAACFECSALSGATAGGSCSAGIAGTPPRGCLKVWPRACADARAHGGHVLRPGQNKKFHCPRLPYPVSSAPPDTLGSGSSGLSPCTVIF